MEFFKARSHLRSILAWSLLDHEGCFPSSYAGKERKHRGPTKALYKLIAKLHHTKLWLPFLLERKWPVYRIETVYSCSPIYHYSPINSYMWRHTYSTVKMCFVAVQSPLLSYYARFLKSLTQLPLLAISVTLLYYGQVSTRYNNRLCSHQCVPYLMYVYIVKVTRTETCYSHWVPLKA